MRQYEPGRSASRVFACGDGDAGDPVDARLEVAGAEDGVRCAVACPESQPASSGAVTAAARSRARSAVPFRRRMTTPLSGRHTDPGARRSSAHDIESGVVGDRHFRVFSARLGITAFAVTGAIALAACSSSSGAKHAPSAGTSAPTSSASSSSAAPKPPAINPLTGLKPSNNPVVAVKIEDTAEARPQVGLDKADIVYIEQVEGGLTRLIAIFDTHLPVVEPIRSTRNDDPEIVAQYGPIIYVASGGSKREYIPLDASPLRQVINDRGGPGFFRDNNRPAPHNLAANLADIARIKKGPKAKSIGLVWSAKILNAATAGTVVDTRVGGTPVLFKWNSKERRYDRYFQGSLDRLANGHDINTPNVIVQFVKGNVYSLDIDPAGNPAWYQHTVGSGRVVVFRDGRRIVGTWSRPHPSMGTRLVDAHGKPIALAPGGAWFVLVNDGTPLS
jgi:hypothetical protein